MKTISITIVALAMLLCAVVTHATEKSEAAYEALNTELEAVGEKIRSEKSMEQRLALIGQIETKLKGFRATFKGTPEAADAGFQLGMLKANMQEWPEAARYLAEFVVDSGGAGKDKIGFAHYYLGQAYENTGNFDDAKREYELILSQFASVNDQLTTAARTSLGSLDAQRQLAVGVEPLAFNVKGIDGQALSPAKFKGKVLLLDFWATWCRPCLQEMPNVKRVYAKYKNEGFEIVGISLDRSRDDLDRYIKANDIPWPQFFDGKFWQNEIAVQYGIKEVPTTFLIDRQGKIRHKALRGAQLEQAVQALLKEKI